MSRVSHHHKLTQLQQHQQMAENEAAALAAEIFDHFCVATTMRQVLGLYRNMCDTIGLRPAPLNDFYPKLKTKIRNWKAQALWKKFDTRAAYRVYCKGNACTGTRVLVIGAGPCGLRTAIEAQLLGAKVVVVEKRDRLSRNNVLHLWPFVITDLRNLGAKKFYGKFCAGSIDHISIRQLQCILLKVALLLGVEVHEGISFINTIEPNDGCGWRAKISPDDHAVSHYEFDVLIGADGKRNTLESFKRKEFRGKLAIAITANFINKKTEAEAKAEEISGVAFIFNQSFFKELYQTTGIDLENIVYYKDETHYFVMTAKKHSLIDKGVIIQDFADPAELLASDNVNTEKLLDYAREAAEFSTKYQMPNLEFAVNHYGKPDVAMFDFTSMFAAESSCRALVRKNYRLLQCLVGDSLLEPFWPTGSGCARGFLSSMDSAYTIKLWANPKNSILAVLAQRESIYRLLAQTTPENLQRDIGAYTVDPATRYPNLNKSTVNVWQVKNLLDSDDKSVYEQTFIDSNAVTSSTPETPIRRKRRTGDSLPLSTVLLRWIKAQLHSLDFTSSLVDVSECFTSGKVLCALINRYRPNLVDLNTLKDLTPVECNELAFKILENELNVPRVMSAKDSICLENIDSKIWLNYLEQICEVFRGEIPHVKHPKLDFTKLKEKSSANNPPDFSHLLKINTKKTKSPMQDADMGALVHRRSILDEDKIRKQRKYGGESNAVQAETSRRAKKRRSHEKSSNIEERQQRLKQIEDNRLERQSKRRLQRFQQTQNFYKSLHMLQANNLLRESDSSSPFEDYSIYLYRQQAPEFNDRVKELERKLLHPDRERGIPSAFPKGGTDEQFSDRIRSMEQRITSRGTSGTDKKPKDLLRAIGKIESSDWNIREIEKKIEQSKKTEIGKSKEKVPKWSKEQFAARQIKMAKPQNKTEIPEEKFKEIDQTLKNLDKQLKEGSILEVGERGKNKVASIAGQFVKKDDISEEKQLQSSKSTAKVNLLFQKQAASEKCHFCKQTVYLMEKISTEGLILHRSCLKCYHCHTNLRLGGYAFDRDDPIGRFYCTQHFKLPAKAIRTVNRKSIKDNRKGNDIGQQAKSLNNYKPTEQTKGKHDNIVQLDLLDRGQTPERIEFENIDAMSDGEPSLENIIDENEWTDRNFITGSEDTESDLSSSDSSDDDSESDAFEEVNGSPIGAQTLQLATDWIGKQRFNDDDDTDDEDFYDSSEGLLDEDGDSQTEGEEFKKAREMRRQEVKLRPPPAYLQTDTETEVQTDSESSSPEDIELNSATEISTDSEFDHDPIIHEAPKIFIDDTHIRKPTKVQIKQGIVGMNQRPMVSNKEKHITVKKEPEFKPLIQVDPSLLISNRIPLKNPNPGDYLLNKAPSTEGIASRKSLELKKRYLLGEQGIGIGIMKSGSTSILDSKFKNFHSNISECQKLLNPALAISPSMKTFLDRTKIGDRSVNKKNSEEKENVFVNCQNELNKNIDYIETKNIKLIENFDKDKFNVIETIDLITPEKLVPKTDKSKISMSSFKNEPSNLTKNPDQVDLSYNKNSNEIGKSEGPDISKVVKIIKPDLITHIEDNLRADDIQDTMIKVPNINWNNNKKDIETDSLSNSSTSSLDDIPHYILESTTSPDTQNPIEQIVPRLEVHDSTGTLMQLDSLMIVDGKYIGDLDDLKLMDVPKGLKINENALIKFDKDNENKIKTLKNIPITTNDKPNTLNFQMQNTNLYDKDKTLTAKKINNDSDSETEITGHGLTETELSDWAADDVVSENFVDDIEFVVNSNKGTIKRNKRGKKKILLNSKIITKDKLIANLKTNEQVKGLNIEEIEFMDTGSENSCTEAYTAATNKKLIDNRGYVEFIDNSKLINSNIKNTLTSLNDNKNICDNLSIEKHKIKEIIGIDYIEQGACILKNDCDVKTPVNENIPKMNENDIEDDSLVLPISLDCTSTGLLTTTTTEDSDALTIVTSPLESPDNIINILKTSSSSSELDKTISNSKLIKNNDKIDDNSKQTIQQEQPLNMNIKRKDGDDINYEDFVRKLQMKITQISNAHDIIDIKKQKRKTSKGDISDNTQNVSVINNKNININDITINTEFSKNNNDNKIILNEVPGLTKKLEEISKERTKQKDLIHDLVMDKLQCKKQINAEKRLIRSRNRNLFVTKQGINNLSNDLIKFNQENLMEKNELNKKTREINSINNDEKLIVKPRPLSDNLDNLKTISDIKKPNTSFNSSNIKTDCIEKNKFDNNITNQFLTPIRPPRTNKNINDDSIISLKSSENTDRLRAEARARARLKSNHDLGISPEEKLQLLRKKYHIELNNIKRSNTINDKIINTNKSDDIKSNERKIITSKSVNDITVYKNSLNSIENYDNKNKLQISDFTSDPSLIDINDSHIKNHRRTKDPERRRSLIQTVSNFFQKKKDNTSVSPVKDKNDSSVFSRLRISPKNKEKSKEKDKSPYEQNVSQDCFNQNASSSYSSTPQLFRRSGEIPPPIPPLPINYQRSDDECCTPELRGPKKQRAISKASRQAELKRLRIAQEIQREQEEIEVKLKELEARGVLIEKSLRGEGQNIENIETSSIGASDERLLKELLEIWRNITQLKRRDEELGIRQQELQLEHRHAQLKDELDIRLSCSKLDKSSSDIAAEGAILNEMLEIVAKRAALRPNDITSLAQNSNDNDTEI